MKQRKILILCVLFFWAFISAAAPPAAMREEYRFNLHGVELVDNYHWLKDKSRSSDKVLQYLEAENAYTDLQMSKCSSRRDSLYNEFLKRIPAEDQSIPYKLGSYWYCYREMQGQQYHQYCRSKNQTDTVPEIYLDVNELAKNETYVNVISLRISPNEKMIAYLADFEGSEVYDLYIKDIKSGDLLTDIIYGADDFCWANDNQTIFYCTSDESGRSDKVWRHTLGESGENDQLLYVEEDDSFYTYVYRSKSRRYIIIGTSSKTGSEIRIIDADNPEDKPLLVEKRREGIEYYLTSYEDEFFVYTNERAKDFELLRVSAKDPQRENWLPFIEGRDGVSFDYSIFKNWLVLFECEEYSYRIRILNLKTGEEKVMNDFPATAVISSSYMPEYNSISFRYLVETMDSPWQLKEYNLITGEETLLKSQQINGFNATNYHSKRLYAEASDGEKIPVSLVYDKRYFKQDGKHPLFLTGYGAYGDNSNPYLSTTKLSLLDRGFCWAIAHVRGGGEMGRRWYDEGKMFNKKNTFTDFIAVSEFLLANNYTSPELFAIEGSSAGGLLIGSVINMRPDLFGVAVLDVPFVDMINTMLDPSLSATVSEYEEWGNPQIKAEFEYMYSYCPYYNIRRQAYPHILLLGGFYDPRVNYWEPAKFAAKLRYNKSDDNLLLLKISDTGHGGASGRYDYLKEIAFEYSFIIDRIECNREKSLQ